jgi:Flp pilus assembly protein TadD
LLKAGRPAEAAEQLRRGLSTQADPEAWLSVGRRLAIEAKSPQAAEAFFRHAAQLRPDQASARQQFGLNLLVLGRCDEAVRELGEAVRLDPSNPDSLSNLAYCELKLGRMSAARSHVEAALKVSPDDELARQLAAAIRQGSVK